MRYMYSYSYINNHICCAREGLAICFVWKEVSGRLGGLNKNEQNTNWDHLFIDWVFNISH